MAWLASFAATLDFERSEVICYESIVRVGINDGGLKDLLHEGHPSTSAGSGANLHRR